MKRPLVVWTAGLSLGIISTNCLGPWAILLPGALLALRLLLRREWLVPMGCAAVIGCLLMVWHAPVWPGPFGSHQMHGRVIAIDQAGDRKSAIVQVNSWAGRKVPWWNPSSVRVTYSAGQVQPGDAVNMEMACRPLPEAKNPGEFAYGQYLRRQGILATATVDQLLPPKDHDGQVNGTSVRKALIDRAMSLGGIPGELLSTLLLGNKPGKWSDSWRQTGTSHILAVSGLHVGLLLLLFERLLSLCRLPVKPRLIIAGLLLLAYGSLVGFRPSVWRSIIMVLVGLLAVLTGRLKDWPSAVALAALLLLLLNPYLLFDPGFQLSFVATISLFTLAPRIKAHLPILPWQLDAVISASAAAQLATLPLVLYHFYLLSPFALGANLLLLPFLPVVMVLGLIWLLLPLQAILRPVLMFLLNAMQYLVDWLSTRPLASFSPGVPPVWLAACYGLLLVFCIAKPWPKLKRLAKGLWVLSLLLLISWQPLVRTLGSQYQLAVLSVGQGSAAVLHRPGGEAVLFDAGGADETVGDWTIVPYLRWMGTWKVGSIYLSHLHDDHVLGLPAVLAGFRVEKVIIPPSALGTTAYAGLLELCKQHGTLVETMSAGEEHRYGRLTVRSIHQGADDATLGENEASLVLQLNHPGLSMLLPGDIGAAEEMTILPYVGSPLDALIVPHHGSAGSSSEVFLSSSSPEHSIISTGPNRYGHPSPAVLQRLGHFTGTVWRTDQHGAVLISVSGTGYMIRPWIDLRP